MPKSMLERQVVSATKTLHLHFVHHFAVKSAVAVRANVLTYRKAGLRSML